MSIPGHPESFQLERNGSRIFANLPGAGQIVVVNRNTAAVIARWPGLASRANYPMALDEVTNRVFVGFRTPASLGVYDTMNGNGVGTAPVVAVEAALLSLKSMGLVRFVHPSHGGRTVRYRHVADERWRLSKGELAVLAVLVLRGPQTTGEVRPHRADVRADDGTVEEILDMLTARSPEPFAARVARRPGEREGAGPRRCRASRRTASVAATTPRSSTASTTTPARCRRPPRHRRHCRPLRTLISPGTSPSSGLASSAWSASSASAKTSPPTAARLDDRRSRQRSGRPSRGSPRRSARAAHRRPARRVHGRLVRTGSGIPRSRGRRARQRSRRARRRRRGRGGVRDVGAAVVVDAALHLGGPGRAAGPCPDGCFGVVAAVDAEPPQRVEPSPGVGLGIDHGLATGHVLGVPVVEEASWKSSTFRKWW